MKNKKRNAQKQIASLQETKTANEQQTFRRPNYAKYEKAKPGLRSAFMTDKTMKEISSETNISVQTLYKYKGLLSLEDNVPYKVPEEETYLKNKQSRSNQN